MSTSGISIQDWSRPVISKCLNSIAEMPCCSLYFSVFTCASHLSAITREPTPLPYFKRIQPGDVGYIHRGCFNLLFSAGTPLDGRELGTDVPQTFNQLDVGTILNALPRLPGCISTKTVREIPTQGRGPMYPYVLSITSVSHITSHVLQDVGTRFQHLVPTHRKSRCCSPDETPNLQGGRSTRA